MGWGGDQNFASAINYYCNQYPPNQDGSLGFGDWMDPWYYNGVTSSTVSLSLVDMISGSHASWELEVGLLHDQDYVNKFMNTLQQNSYYDPLWQNTRLKFNQSYFEPVAQQARVFAAKCANETRNDMKGIYDTPIWGLCRAIRAELTLFRGSMSAIQLNPQYYPLGGGKYKVTCNILNTHRSENLLVGDIRFSKRVYGQWTHEIQPVNRSLGPNQEGPFTREVNVKPGEKLDVFFEVAGSYEKTPDIGFSAKGLKIKESDERPPDRINPAQDVGDLSGVWHLNCGLYTRLKRAGTGKNFRSFLEAPIPTWYDSRDVGEQISLWFTRYKTYEEREPGRAKFSLRGFIKNPPRGYHYLVTGTPHDPVNNDKYTLIHDNGVLYFENGEIFARRIGNLP